MKLLLDENLSPRLARRLRDIFPGSAHVHECGLGAEADAQIWEFAKFHDYVVLTKDSDYSERGVILGFPPKVVWIRIGNCTSATIESILRRNSILIHAFETDENAVLVLR